MTTKEELLLDLFKRNRTAAGYLGICEKLIKDGNCLTTIHAHNLFLHGGIHNFVTSEDYLDGVDLIMLSFDIVAACSSALFRECATSALASETSNLEALELAVATSKEKLADLERLLA